MDNPTKKHLRTDKLQVEKPPIGRSPRESRLFIWLVRQGLAGWYFDGRIPIGAYVKWRDIKKYGSKLFHVRGLGEAGYKLLQEWLEIVERDFPELLEERNSLELDKQKYEKAEECDTLPDAVVFAAKHADTTRAENSCTIYPDGLHRYKRDAEGDYVFPIICSCGKSWDGSQAEPES